MGAREGRPYTTTFRLTNVGEGFTPSHRCPRGTPLHNDIPIDQCRGGVYPLPPVPARDFPSFEAADAPVGRGGWRVLVLTSAFEESLELFLPDPSENPLAFTQLLFDREEGW